MYRRLKIALITTCVALSPALPVVGCYAWMILGYVYIEGWATSIGRNTPRSQVDATMAFAAITPRLISSEEAISARHLGSGYLRPGYSLVEYRLTWCPVLTFNVVFDAEGRSVVMASVYE